MPVAQTHWTSQPVFYQPESCYIIAVDVYQHSVSNSSEMPGLQPARPASQLTVAQSVTGISENSLSTSSTASATYHYSDSDSEQQTDLTLPCVS